MKFTYKTTLKASYLGYITQAIVVNVAPLLFVTFRESFGISTGLIGLLISINFGVQIIVDSLAAKFVDKTGFRAPAVLAHIFAALGLVMMAVLPGIMPPYAGLVTATVFMAIGGGLTEVIISPIVEALPGDEKASAMSLLHSFYSWGQVSVVLVSTGFFLLFGVSSWRVLAVLWAIIPTVNIFLFAKVPIRTLVGESERQPLSALFRQGGFLLLILLMICSGASEQAMAQWASMFAEAGLGVSKALGDILGPCMFALLMGVARTYYGMNGSRIKLTRALALSGALGVVSYIVTIFAPSPIVSLLGCALTGLAVGLMWPGVLSLSSAACPLGGAAMFAVLALGGDVGCSIGPGLVGTISGMVEAGKLPAAVSLFGPDLTTAGLKAGLLVGMVFPLLLLIGVLALKGRKKA